MSKKIHSTKTPGRGQGLKFWRKPPPPLVTCYATNRLSFIKLFWLHHPSLIHSFQQAFSHKKTINTNQASEQTLAVLENIVGIWIMIQTSLIFKWSKPVLLSNGFVFRHHLKSELQSLDFQFSKGNICLDHCNTKKLFLYSWNGVS
jgi:hypothetical protein